MPGKILIVDDERSLCELLHTDLRMRGFTSRWCLSADDAQRTLQEEEFDVVLTDVRMSGRSGLELCEQIAASRPDLPVIVMTAFGSLDTAVAAIRVGAYDFVTKPIELDLLALILDRAVQHRQLREKIKLLSAAVQRHKGFADMLGDSPAMRRLVDQLTRIADSETSVLITGESGTGKELVARAIHRQSRRGRGPFVAVNVAALPEMLLESELFGHVRGAFTDARTDRTGLILQAEGGTLLLDEIGELPLTMQAKLLRALEARQVRPVGGDHERPFNVRLLSATNRDLEAAVEEQRFREDLYFRIQVIQVDVPPLRARGTDVLLLAQHFVRQFAERSGKQVVGSSDRAAERLLAYAWPGNVRELRNVIERAVALTHYDQIVVEDLPEKIRDYRSSQVLIGSDNPTELVPLEEVERRYILHVLKAVGGSKTTAARILGLDRKTLYRKLKQYGIEDES
ncbi:MAG: sigma-54 dependent transcriptional regulator [Planctomycetota bacterium]|nr:sigma-54 dependent transcriptional regulator [Planctomycetota bacterium]